MKNFIDKYYLNIKYMTTKIIDTPNTLTSNLIDQLKGINEQGRKYARYDKHAPEFKYEPSEMIEPFFTFKKFMFDKILIIFIIGLLAIFIMKAMEFM